ncbi:MAG: rod shape-determining protein MreC [Candidatus Hydrogenedens sp.]|nr:rod shape-determining protein MreC [Candidatus Hydrogenedentota bacterium]NLF58370.1 rod shape-determining protein MreC [Candidatus Hydrogenedens sp.]
MLNLGRILSEHRPVALLAVLVLGSLVSLVRGTESSLVRGGVVRVVAATAWPFLEARRAVSGAAGDAYRFVSDYQGALDEAKALGQEVAKLKTDTARLAMLQAENGRLRNMLGFVRENPRLTLEPVTVLESYKGMLRIDRGGVHGIRPSMCVVSTQGVVGVVTEVADFTSTVATLHHMDCRVGAMVLRNRLRAYDGVVQASGNDLSRICTMEYIDMKEEVRVGDIIVTSPESLFPAGLMIGRISAVHDGGSLWKSAEVVPAVDPYTLDEVFLIRRTVEDPSWLSGPKEDFLGMTARTRAAAGEAVSAGTPAPDLRTLQERFAP